MKTIVAIAACLALVCGSGCQHAAPFVGPDGRQGYSVDCSGTAVPMASCYNQAAKLCPAGYEPINSSNQRGNAFIPGAGIMPTSHKSLEFVCKAPAAPLVQPAPQ